MCEYSSRRRQAPLLLDGLRDSMSKSEEWQEPRFSREAFGPAQLREGAKSTGGIGGCPEPDFGYLTPTTFALAPQAVRPATAGLRRKFAEHDHNDECLESRRSAIRG